MELLSLWDVGGQDGEMFYLFPLCIASMLTSGKMAKFDKL